jgi:hypothetical protein
MLQSKIVCLIIVPWAILLNAADAPIDVVIPCHEKDIRTLDLVIDGVKKYVKNLRRIIVVSSAQYTQQAEWFDQARYPFSKEDVFQLACGGGDRERFNKSRIRDKVGWLYQQFLKLYAHRVIPNIADNILIVDAETIFLRDISFIDQKGFALYCLYDDGFWKTFFFHAQKFLPEIKQRFNAKSGESHHMLFQRHVLEHMFAAIEKRYRKEPWRAMCASIDKERLVFSEYEIYVNYAFAIKANVKVRPLKWKNMAFSLEGIKQHQLDGYDFVTCHTYLSPEYLKTLQEIGTR